MRSLTEFLIIAVVVTLTPGPGTATILRVAARDGRKAAMSAIVENGAGVLIWGILSVLGVSSLIRASQFAFDTLRVVGAAVLIVIGLRSLLQRRGAAGPDAEVKPRRRAGWRSGLVTSVSNPKLAVFFVALFPQFLTRGSPELPYAPRHGRCDRAAGLAVVLHPGLRRRSRPHPAQGCGFTLHLLARVGYGLGG